MLPSFPVILTKVRIQDYERQRFWLWVLTFVRMTGVVARSPYLTTDN